ncbi:hypothetical protein [Halostella sp. PRR32]|uniref:hypothetical protein n=1 Tax=Halostella sp. PRR32 TaxID=3098147 RepID=UPI002B1E12D3|nr:hypothetical protein [Halostella sp. PRR32]
MTYVAPEDLEHELPFDEHDFPLQDSAQWDSAVERALAAASEQVEEWGDTRYETTDATTTLSRPAHAAEYDLPLPKRPIQSVASVDAGGETLTEGDDYVVHETHLELLPDAAVSEWPTDRRSITVSWTWGYDGAPEPVREAVIRLARNALDQIETDGIGSDNEFSYRPPSELKRECAAMVKQHDAPSYGSGVGVI